MNPLGSGVVVVQNGFIVDDADFYTPNGGSCQMRAYRVTDANGVRIAGCDPANPLGWRVPKTDPRPWIVTRPELGSLDFAAVGPPGLYDLTLWGVEDSDPTYFEIGSGNPEDNGTTYAWIHTAYIIGESAVELLRRGVEQLHRSSAYRSGFTNVVQGTAKCEAALKLLGG